MRYGDPLRVVSVFGRTVVAVLLLSLGCVVRPAREVRYEPSPMPVVRAMLEFAGVGPNDVVYDLGSGDGRIPITAAREFGARGIGIEIDPALVSLSRKNARKAGVEGRVEFSVGDMYEADVRPATVVTLFLHPKPNLKLRPRLLSQLEPGSRVISYLWDMGDWKPDAVRTINKRHLYLWRIPDGERPRPVSLESQVCCAPLQGQSDFLTKPHVRRN